MYVLYTFPSTAVPTRVFLSQTYKSEICGGEQWRQNFRWALESGLPKGWKNLEPWVNRPEIKSVKWSRSCKRENGNSYFTAQPTWRSLTLGNFIKGHFVSRLCIAEVRKEKCEDWKFLENDGGWKGKRESSDKQVFQVRCLKVKMVLKPAWKYFQEMYSSISDYIFLVCTTIGLWSLWKAPWIHTIHIFQNQAWKYWKDIQTVEIYSVDAEIGNDLPSNLKHVFEVYLIGSSMIQF